jgi:hypothetical protein
MACYLQISIEFHVIGRHQNEMNPFIHRLVGGKVRVRQGREVVRDYRQSIRYFVGFRYTITLNSFTP